MQQKILCYIERKAINKYNEKNLIWDDFGFLFYTISVIFKFTKEGIMRLEGKTAIITGGGGDIGKGIARCFAKEGANLLLVDLKEEAAQKAAEETSSLGIEAIAMAADLTKENEVEKVFSEAVGRLKSVDVLDFFDVILCVFSKIHPICRTNFYTRWLSG